LLALTLPHDVLAALRRIHPDPAWAIVLLHEKVAKTQHRAPSPAKPAIELAELSPRSALIVVDPQTVRSVPGMSVVPVASGRAFLAFDEGRGLADLELAIIEQLQDPKVSRTAREEMNALRRQVRDWRRGRGFRVSKRSIILVERARVSRARTARPRTSASGRA
jgi:hypothetical protein